MDGFITYDEYVRQCGMQNATANTAGTVVITDNTGTAVSGNSYTVAAQQAIISAAQLGPSMPANEYRLRVMKATNGWVVQIDRPGKQTDYADVMVVKDGERLGEAIGAMITGEILTGRKD